MFCCATNVLFIEDVAQKQNYLKGIIYGTYLLAMRTMASILSPEMTTISRGEAEGNAVVAVKGDNKPAAAIVRIVSKKVFYYTDENCIVMQVFLDGNK